MVLSSQANKGIFRGMARKLILGGKVMNKKEAYENYIVAESNFNNATGEWVEVAALQFEAARKACIIVMKEAINDVSELSSK
jgi:hypothetical protein